MKNKLITSLALAATLAAGAIHSRAQSVSPSAPPSTTPRDTPPPAPSTNNNTNTKSDPNAPVSNQGGTPRPIPGGPATTPPVTGTVPIMLPPDAAGNGGGGAVNNNGRVVPPPPSGAEPGKVPPSGNATPPRVILFDGRAVPPPASGTPVPLPTPIAGSVTISVGDIPGNTVRPLPADGSTGASPVVLVAEQFAVQRNQELNARAAALEQLRTATPDQRAAIIADMQATQARAATEQREAARELRNELRALREERKGK